MFLSGKKFDLEPHNSGKTTCWVATTQDGGMYFVKFPRTVEDSHQGGEEIFSELLGADILSRLNIQGIQYSVEQVNFKLAIVERFHSKNWSNSSDEGIVISNYDQWSLLLTAEAWMGQSDRAVGKPEHVGLVSVDDVGKNYNAIPIDLGHAFVGQPSGNQALDESLTPDYVKGIFWANREMSETDLEAAISKVDELPVVEIVNGVVDKILSVSSWPENFKVYIKKHADQVTFFLLLRRKRLKGVLLEWYRQYKSQTTSTPDVDQRVVVV